MAIYVNQTANIFKLEAKTSSKGNNYVTCDVVFYSKSKDKEGQYTVEDKPFTVKGTAFGSVAKELLEREGKIFVEIFGKLYDYSYEKDDKKVYVKRFDIFSVKDVAFTKGNATPEEPDADDEDIPF